MIHAMAFLWMSFKVALMRLCSPFFTILLGVPTSCPWGLPATWPLAVLRDFEADISRNKNLENTGLTETQTLLWLDQTAYTHIHTHTLHKQTQLHTEHKHDAHTLTQTHTHFTNKHTYTLNTNIHTHIPLGKSRGISNTHTHSHTHTLKSQAKLFFTITTKLEPQRHNHCIVGSKANKPRQHKSQQA